MVFTGKPSKGCLPCREKRTKCDLALPSCTQCIKKKRICVGYRKAQDVLFKNQTALVVQRVQKKESRDRFERSSSDETNHSGSVNSFDVVPEVVPEAAPQVVPVDDDAAWKFVSFFNEKFFEASETHPENGYDHLLPLSVADVNAGGPVPEIIRASGLAALGNMIGCPEILRGARIGKGRVLRLLFEQLQDPDLRLSDSSMLTCILLGALESILNDPTGSSQAMAHHLKGASVLAELRSTAPPVNNIGNNVYQRVRGLVLAYCLQNRKALPEFTLVYLEEQGGSIHRDTNPECFYYLAQLCELRAEHKATGIVDTRMAEHARSLIELFNHWDPDVPDWTPGLGRGIQRLEKNREDKIYNCVLISTLWTFEIVCCILGAELVVAWAQSRVDQAPPSDPTAAAELKEALQLQRGLCNELREGFDYYMAHYKDEPPAMRIVGAYSLLWPIYVLSTSPSFASADDTAWIKCNAEDIAEEFGIFRKGSRPVYHRRTKLNGHR